LNMHPRLAVAPSVYGIAQFFETRTGLNPAGMMAPELVLKWLEKKRFDPFEVERNQIERLIPPGMLLPYSRFISRLLDLHGQAKGKQLVGSKTLEFIRFLPAAHAIWPRAKFIHLVRDGRDVCLAVLNWQEPHMISRQFKSWAE